MSSSMQPWSFVPHQHQGSAAETAPDAHIRSPRNHNGTFKAGGITTFMGAPYCVPEREAIRAAGAKICFLGVPWDQGQIVRAGTSQGPAGLREASTQYFPYMFEYDVDLLTFFRVVDCGDVPIVPGNNDRSHEYIYQYVSECLHGGAQVILCGGDHSVPIPSARALSDFHKNGKIGYIHIDCHLDSAPDWCGIDNTNCSGPSRALELPNCDRSNIAHMGSRNGLNPKDWMDFFVDNDVRVIPMYEVAERGYEACTREIFDIAWKGTDGIYCSWDTDSLDASCMPGTTAAEPFGIKGREAIQVARIAGTYGADIFEISELAPLFDISQMSIKLACCLAYHYLGSRAKTLREQGKEP
ncbi:MAG: agmatinase family protein [Proteobacteria bacterium]|nr:agmatinase family protein [Pseudomonadota bacterium]